MKTIILSPEKINFLIVKYLKGLLKDSDDNQLETPRKSDIGFYVSIFVLIIFSILYLLKIDPDQITSKIVNLKDIPEVKIVKAVNPNFCELEVKKIFSSDDLIFLNLPNVNFVFSESKIIDKKKLKMNLMKNIAKLKKNSMIYSLIQIDFSIYNGKVKVEGLKFFDKSKIDETKKDKIAQIFEDWKFPKSFSFEDKLTIVYNSK